MALEGYSVLISCRVVSLYCCLGLIPYEDNFMVQVCFEFKCLPWWLLFACQNAHVHCHKWMRMYNWRKKASREILVVRHWNFRGLVDFQVSNISFWIKIFSLTNKCESETGLFSNIRSYCKWSESLLCWAKKPNKQTKNRTTKKKNPFR